MVQFTGKLPPTFHELPQAIQGQLAAAGDDVVDQMESLMQALRISAKDVIPVATALLNLSCMLCFVGDMLDGRMKQQPITEEMKDEHFSTCSSRSSTDSDEQHRSKIPVSVRSSLSGTPLRSTQCRCENAIALMDLEGDVLRSFPDDDDTAYIMPEVMKHVRETILEEIEYHNGAIRQLMRDPEAEALSAVKSIYQNGPKDSLSLLALPDSQMSMSQTEPHFDNDLSMEDQPLGTAEESMEHYEVSIDVEEAESMYEMDSEVSEMAASLRELEITPNQVPERQGSIVSFHTAPECEQCSITDDTTRRTSHEGVLQEDLDCSWSVDTTNWPLVDSSPQQVEPVAPGAGGAFAVEETAHDSGSVVEHEEGLAGSEYPADRTAIEKQVEAEHAGHVAEREDQTADAPVQKTSSSSQKGGRLRKIKKFFSLRS